MVKLNVLNLEKSEYKGGKSSLCLRLWPRSNLQCDNPSRMGEWHKARRNCEDEWNRLLVQDSCIFPGEEPGFNTVHGRMPSVTTGANMINKDLAFIAVSGDGDTASIGIGQFIHAIRRNLDMVYIIENNGVYGLTKGQYSATVEKGSKKKKGTANEQAPIDLCAMAINLGCTFVARSFSGSKKQLTACSEPR